MAWRERLPGGVAAGMSPADFDARELARGALHETEHTRDFMVAVEIAMDHLAEDPSYYKKLAKIEGTNSRPKRRRKKKAKKATRRRGGSSKRVNLLVRDLFRDLYRG
jgi:hypothetical protein